MRAVVIHIKGNRNYFTDDTAGRFRDDMFNPRAVLHLVLYIDGLICIIVQESSKSIVCIAAAGGNANTGQVH